MAWLSFVALLIVLTYEGVYLARRFWRSWGSRGTDVCLVFVLISAFLVSLPPAYYCIFTGNVESLTFRFGLGTWLRGLAMEVVFYGVFILVFRWKRADTSAERLAGSLRATPDSLAFLIALLVASLVCYWALMGVWTDAGYEAAGNYYRANLASDESAMSTVQGTFYRGLIIPLVCMLLFYLPRRGLTFFGYPVLLLGFAYIAVKSLASGGRGAVLEVFLAAASCFLASGKRLRSLAYIGGVLLFLWALTPAIYYFRIEARRYVGFSPWEKAQVVYERWASSQGSQGEYGTSWVDLRFERLDGVQDAGILAEHTADTNEFATYKPFVGSLVATFPRYFWRDKPLPMSIDQTVPGLPWYLVMTYRGQRGLNGGVSTPGVAYWQFGWLGVVLTAAGGALFFRYLSTLAIRGGAMGLLLFLSFCVMTHFRLPVALDETLFVLCKVVLPVFFVWWGYTTVLSSIWPTGSLVPASPRPHPPRPVVHR